jgi:hypothetical protein
MNSNSIWTQFFHLPQEAINQWLQEASDKKSLLLWCMENGALEPHEYLEWARGQYNLPSVGTQFFNENKDFNFWSKLKDQAQWSEEFAPISEWDGMIYIGCLQPPQNSDFLFPVQYVLAHVMDLKNHWKILNPPPAKNISAEENTTVLRANEWENKLNDWANTQSQVEILENQFAEAPEVVPSPEGEFTKMTSSQTEAFRMEVTDENKKTTHFVPPIPENQPDGLNLKTNIPSANAYDPLEELRRSLAVSDDADANINITNELPNLDVPDGMNFSLNKETSVESDLMPEGFNLNLKQVPATAITTEANDLIIAPLPVVAQPAAAIMDDSHTTGTYTGFLAEFYTHFQAGMVLDVENETYIPVMWNEGFKRNDTDNVKRYSLNEASCFRIAYRTQMPYIGYVVNTPQNTDFFNSFGFSELPKMILVQPVIVDKKVIALLLATFEHSKKTHHVMSAGEDLAQKYIKNRSLFAKKAA